MPMLPRRRRKHQAALAFFLFLASSPTKIHSFEFSTRSSTPRLSKSNNKRQVGVVSQESNNNESLQQRGGGSSDTTPHTPLAHRLFSFFHTIDGIVFLSYFANVMTMSLPILLVPIAAAEFSTAAAGDTLVGVASRVAQISSTATLGGAMGKFMNGFLCQAFGERTCSPVYFCGLSLVTIWFSLTRTPHSMALAYAAMEFCASMQWVALSVLLAQYYQNDNTRALASALTALGLSSACGQVFAKTVGAAMASTWHWRTVARVGAVGSLLGAVCVQAAPQQKTARTTTKRPRESRRFSFVQSVGESLWAVLGSPLFWIFGFGHGMAFVTRGCDRILGTFYQHVVPDLSTAMAGAMTLAVTVGLMRGLVVGSKVLGGISSAKKKKQRLAKWYLTQVLAGAGLAVMALPQVLDRLPSNSILRASIVGMLTAAMASNVAFQFYQFPAMIAQALYRDHAAVTIGFLDGCGFLLSTPIFAATSAIVPKYGWPAAWAMMTSLFAVAGALMLFTIGPALDEKKKR